MQLLSKFHYQMICFLCKNHTKLRQCTSLMSTSPLSHFLLISTSFMKSEFFPYLTSIITGLYIDTFSLLSYRPGDKKKKKKPISFTTLSLSKCLMLVCYIAKQMEVPLVLEPLMPLLEVWDEGGDHGATTGPVV